MTVKRKPRFGTPAWTKALGEELVANLNRNVRAEPPPEREALSPEEYARRKAEIEADRKRRGKA